MNALDQYTTIISLAVAWGDMDALNHVNNAVYFKYFESARLAFMEEIDCWKLLGKEGIAPVLASTSARYKIPLTYPDTIDVGARISEVGNDRFTQEYAIYSHTHRRIASLGNALVVTVDSQSGRKTRLPTELKTALEKCIGH
jgi:acyl-CoA thioester hydrolase